ncbi:MAG: hypothetical protein EAS52_05330 [Parapedobacter sp.]|nr:MAG: hypothetical protein EAS52_05330 [Parapedobacter sp.]
MTIYNLGILPPSVDSSATIVREVIYKPAVFNSIVGAKPYMDGTAADISCCPPVILNDAIVFKMGIFNYDIICIP